MYEEQQKRIQGIADEITEIQELSGVSRASFIFVWWKKIDIGINQYEQQNIGCRTSMKTVFKGNHVSSYVSVLVPGGADVMERVLRLSGGTAVNVKCLFGFDAKASSLTLIAEEIDNVPSVLIVVD
jgi:hypothetical protein